MDIVSFASEEDAASVLAEAVSENIQSALQDHGSASLALSGGSTPVKFLQALAGKSLDWSNIIVTTTDERQVPADDARSNARLIKENLIDHVEQPVSFAWMFENAETYAFNPALNDLLPLDVCILGMGLDGHTASLFPGIPAELLSVDYAENLQSVVPANGLEPRVTFTLPPLMNARSVYLLIHGHDKRAVLDQACAGVDEMEMPIRSIIKQANDKMVVYSVEP